MHRDDLIRQLHHYQAESIVDRLNASVILAFVLLNRSCFNAEHPPTRGDEKDDQMGHITGSAWLLSPDRRKVLLTYHKKLNKWLQLGGHSDGCPNVLETALREAREESGIANVQPLSNEVFDVDVHKIPGTATRPEHLHYDVRYILISPDTEEFVTSEESHELKWVSFEDVSQYSTEESVLRMVRKWQKNFLPPSAIH